MLRISLIPFLSDFSLGILDVNARNTASHSHSVGMTRVDLSSPESTKAHKMAEKLPNVTILQNAESMFCVESTDCCAFQEDLRKKVRGSHVVDVLPFE